MQANVNSRSDIVQIVCAIIAVGFFGTQWGPWVSGGTWDVAAFLFPAWVGAPYIIALIAIHLFHLSKRGISIVSIMSVICCVVGSLYLYVQTVAHPDAMAGMLFLVVPIFQVFAVVASIVAAKVVSIAQLERNT